MTHVTQLVPGDLQSTIDSSPTTATVERSLSPSQAGILAVNSSISNHAQKSTLPVHAVIPTTASLPSSPTLQPTSRTKGLDLVTRKVSSNKATVALAERLAEEAAIDAINNPWGNDDLIDINADQDDWST
jgi:SCY1-like protein 1